MSNKDLIDDDFDYARAQYYKLAEEGQEAIELMMDLARESEHPRAFEVLSNMMKQNAEITDRLMDLQKKKKDVLSVPEKADQPQLTQNNVFVGSATDLQKMLHAKKERVVIDQDAQDQE
jgi:hypothetical protein